MGKVPADKVFTAEEAAKFKADVVARDEAKQWRFSGNFNDPTEAVDFVNRDPAQGAGEAIFGVSGDLTPVWIFV